MRAPQAWDRELGHLSRRALVMATVIFLMGMAMMVIFWIYKPHRTHKDEYIWLDPLVTVVVEGQRYGHCYLVPRNGGYGDAVICDRELEQVPHPQSYEKVIIANGHRFKHCGGWGVLPDGKRRVGCVERL